MNSIFGFTLRSKSGQLYSWLIEAKNRNTAISELRSGDNPDEIVILTLALNEEQQKKWADAAVRLGGINEATATREIWGEDGY